MKYLLNLFYTIVFENKLPFFFRTSPSDFDDIILNCCLFRINLSIVFNAFLHFIELVLRKIIILSENEKRKEQIQHELILNVFLIQCISKDCTIIHSKMSFVVWIFLENLHCLFSNWFGCLIETNGFNLI